MPKFSIITTTYKHEKYIAQTIDSILAQSFSDWELLIGDDSPDDATWDIVREYTKKYPDKIKAWHHAPNKGIVGNMNFLLTQISPDSQYITFLEGDDLYIPSSLEEKSHIFQKYSDVGLVYSDMDFINAESEITLRSLLASGGVRMYHDDSIARDEYILSKNPLIVSYSSIAVRKEVLELLLPIRNLTQSKIYAVSDYDLIFRIIENHRVYGIGKSLTLYRRHANNLSASYGGLFDDLLVLLADYRDAHKISADTYTKKASWIYILKSIASLASGDKKGAWKHIQKSTQESKWTDISYKISIYILLVLPTFIVSKVLQKRIRRGS